MLIKTDPIELGADIKMTGSDTVGDTASEHQKTTSTTAVHHISSSDTTAIHYLHTTSVQYVTSGRQTYRVNSSSAGRKTSRLSLPHNHQYPERNFPTLTTKMGQFDSSTIFSTSRAVHKKNRKFLHLVICLRGRRIQWPQNGSYTQDQNTTDL
jgi:hypothetical protein